MHIINRISINFSKRRKRNIEPCCGWVDANVLYMKLEDILQDSSALVATIQIYNITLRLTVYCQHQKLDWNRLLVLFSSAPHHTLVQMIFDNHLQNEPLLVGFQETRNPTVISHDTYTSSFWTDEKKCFSSCNSDSTIVNSIYIKSIFFIKSLSQRNELKSKIYSAKLKEQCDVIDK